MLTLFIFSSVFKAVNIPEHRVAACKFIALTERTTETERKTVEKEMRVHAALKHEHVLEFINAVVVDLKHKQTYIPGIYMLLEFAGGGDLFDKIGMLTFISRKGLIFSPLKTAPDVGVDEDIAHLYFNHLISGMV